MSTATKGAVIGAKGAGATATEDVLLSFKEACAFLRISRTTLYRRMEDGEITGAKSGRLWRFWRSTLVASLKARGV